MIEVWTDVTDKDGNTAYKRIASYADNVYKAFKGWHKGMDFKSDGLTTYMA